MNYLNDYFDKIINDEIVAGKWLKLLAQYILDGLENGMFEYDHKKAVAAIDWIEAHCFHTEGPLAPGPFLLELWQKAIVSCLFGIIDTETGNRQFRECVLIVSRKNGKSLFAAAIAKYTLYIDGGYGARVYCLAPKLEQTDIIYSNVWQMITLDPEWQALKIAIEDSGGRHYKRTMSDEGLAKRRQSDIYLAENNSSVKKIAFSAKKSDGFNPSLAICDEIASWEGDRGLKMYEVMKSGMGARPESIMFSCSTAGYIYDSIYDELFKRSTRVLLGESKEKRLLPFLYTIDDIEKWNDVRELRKSNPNMDVSITSDYLQEEIAVAEGSLSKRSEFLCKYCNVKQNSSQAWLLAQDIEQACGSSLSLDSFKGSFCVGGIDLSRSTDLTACNVAIEKDGEIYIFSKFFLPAERIDEATERDGVPYRIYIERGLLKPSGDNYIDYHDCFDWFRTLVEEYEIYPLKIGYDRYSAQYLVQDMEQYGFHMDDVYQGDNLYPVLLEFEGLLKDRKIHIGDNDLLKIHMLNSAIKYSVERGRGKLVKLNQSDHIDGMAAVADAFCVRQKWYGEIGEQLSNEE